MSDESFERDLRLALRSLAPDSAPISLRRAAAQAEAVASRQGGLMRRLVRPRDGWLEPLLSGAVGLVGLGLIAVLAAVLVISAGGRPGRLGPGAGGQPAISWDTGFVTFEAGAVVIEAGGKQFVGPAQPASVSSDPGSSDYRTLEVTWRDQGIEMRLNLYFAADEDEWWVSEVRTYDGGAPGDWITYRGTFFRSDLGSSWTGDVDLTGGAGRTSGGLHIDDLRLTAFAPGTVHAFEGCTAIGPTAAPGDGPVGHPIDQPFADTGIHVGISASAAHALLTERGICHDFRLSWMYAGSANTGYSQRWCAPPPGKVGDAAWGSDGQVILFVDDPTPRTPDPNTSRWVGC